MNSKCLALNTFYHEKRHTRHYSNYSAQGFWQNVFLRGKINHRFKFKKNLIKKKKSRRLSGLTKLLYVPDPCLSRITSSCCVTLKYYFVLHVIIRTLIEASHFL